MEISRPNCTRPPPTVWGGWIMTALFLLYKSIVVSQEKLQQNYKLVGIFIVQESGNMKHSLVKLLR